MKFDGIIFDLDGTLWDSCRVVAESWRKTMAERYGLTEHPDETAVRSIMGLTEQEIADRLFLRYGSLSREICSACINGEPEYISVRGGDIYPGTEAVLDKLSRKYKLFIVSNCEEGYIQSFFAYSGYGRFFTDIEYEGHTGLGKADNIRLLRERCGLKTPVYIGDTEKDEKSAGEAGCAFIHAAYGFGRAVSPDAVLKSVSDLPELLESL